MTKAKSTSTMMPIVMPKHMMPGMGESAVAKNAIADVALVTVIAVTARVYANAKRSCSSAKGIAFAWRHAPHILDELASDASPSDADA